jgi:hypothetical protein
MCVCVYFTSSTSYFSMAANSFFSRASIALRRAHAHRYTHMCIHTLHDLSHQGAEEIVDARVSWTSHRRHGFLCVCVCVCMCVHPPRSPEWSRATKATARGRRGRRGGRRRARHGGGGGGGVCLCLCLCVCGLGLAACFFWHARRLDR